jgi:hypothetical protein
MFLPASANADQRAALLARVRPTLLVLFPETAHLIPDAVDGHVVFVGVGFASSCLDRLARAQSDLPLRTQMRPDDLAVVVSSGGTTGVPKCSRRSFATYSTMVGAANDEDRRQLINGPLAYLSQVLVDTTLIGGGTVVLKRRYDPAETLATIESERITDVLLVEPQLFETMDHPDVDRRDLSSLRSIAHVGGSAPAVLRQRAITRLVLCSPICTVQAKPVSSAFCRHPPTRRIRTCWLARAAFELASRYVCVAPMEGWRVRGSAGPLKSGRPPWQTVTTINRSRRHTSFRMVGA